MSRITCDPGGADHVPCRCDPVTGCGHASSWHVVTERWLARCTVPGCDCRSMDVCDCVEGVTEPVAVETDSGVLSALGIML